MFFNKKQETFDFDVCFVSWVPFFCSARCGLLQTAKRLLGISNDTVVVATKIRDITLSLAGMTI